MTIDELKIRVWDKNKKIYFKNEHLDIYFSSTGHIRILDKTTGECISSRCIERSLGRKDKNGKLIFESDILQRMVQPLNQFGYKENYKVKKLGYYLPEGEKYGIFSVYLWGTDCEIIGNIHENPKLMRS